MEAEWKWRERGGVICNGPVMLRSHGMCCNHSSEFCIGEDKNSLFWIGVYVTFKLHRSQSGTPPVNEV